MPSKPIVYCVRKSDSQLIKCCRYSGGPVSQRYIEDMLLEKAERWSVVRGRRELILLCSDNPESAKRILVGDWIVVEQSTPKTYSDMAFREKYHPMHHSVR